MSQSSQTLSSTRHSDELNIDVTLVFGETRVPCHRVVLSASCDFFRRMFQSGMQETRSPKVVIQGIEGTVGLLIVEYLYSGGIPLTKDNAEDLLKASDMMMLFELKSQVEQFLLGHVEPKNCIGMLIFSQVFNLKKLGKLSHDCLWENFCDVTEFSDEIDMLPEKALEHMIKDDELNVPNEDLVFVFLRKWAGCRPGRNERFIDMVHHVRLPFCTTEFFSDVVQRDVLMNSSQGLHLIREAMERQTLNQHIISIHRPRTSYAQHSLVVGDDDNVWQLDSCHPQEWCVVGDVPFRCEYYSACSTPEGFIVSGGRDVSASSCDCKRGCYLYVAQDNHWRILPSMSKGRSDHSSVYHKRTLYVVGGGEHRSAEKLDLDTLEWISLPSLPITVYRSYLAIAKDRLFAIGGWRNISEEFNREAFECCSNVGGWRSRSAMPEVCSLGATTSFEDKIFVVGGMQRCSLCYDPCTDTWLRLQRPLHVHRWGPALSWRGKIVLCGGNGVDIIEEYDPKTDRWTCWTLKMPKKGGMCFAVKV